MLKNGCGKGLDIGLYRQLGDLVCEVKTCLSHFRVRHHLLKHHD
jgi:hypothetical protein